MTIRWEGVFQQPLKHPIPVKEDKTMSDFAKIRKFNASLRQDDGYFALPVIPSIEMMLAAARRRDVYRTGDTLSDYVVPWDFEPADRPPDLPLSLVDEYGMQTAFVLAFLSDAWAGCMGGFMEWRKRRGREGDTNFVQSWLKALPTVCPDGGWPETSRDVTDAHHAHASSVPTPCAARSGPAWWEFEGKSEWHGPAKCVAIMALRARQMDCSSRLCYSFDELIDTDKLPYVPRYSMDHRFDDDERSAMLIAAMWDAAVGSLVTEIHHRPMPTNAHGHAARLVEEVARGRNYNDGWIGFYAHSPYRELAFDTDSGRFKAMVGDDGIDWEAEHRPSGTLVSRKNADLRYPVEADRMREMLLCLDGSKSTSNSLVPL